MASESTEEQMSVTLPADLSNWLDEHAASLDIDREQLLVQLVASYRTTAELDEDTSGTIFDTDSMGDPVEEYVDEQFEDELDWRIEETVQSILADTLDEQVEATVDQVATDTVSEATNAVQKQLSNRIDALEQDIDEKIDDVRTRVIQVKREADGKARRDHTHDEFEAVEELKTDVATLQTELEQLRESYDETVPEQEAKVGEIKKTLDAVQDRLQTVAWVVSDLREAQEKGGGLQAVERIKRAAAKADIERANCQNCGQGVTLSLMTDPNCPHCDTTVTDIEPKSGWFGSAKLLTASQLESGEKR